ncbi:TIGR03085 family metal-binding protein [Angustibacter peucedani]
MSHFARAERHALCDTFVAVGPDAPTKCEGWETRDLAAHLVVRERRPDAQAGIYLAPLAGRTAAVQGDLAAGDWPALVEQVRTGPPFWHPARVPAVDEAMNLVEFYVHHEDVLRAQPGWRPRVLDPALERSLWKACSTMGRLVLRRAQVGVELVAPGHGRLTARRGHPTVRVEGAPGELVLFVYGRRDVADVALDGPNQAIDQLRETPAGL